GPRDLADVADGLAPFDEGSRVRHVETSSCFPSPPLRPTRQRGPSQARRAKQWRWGYFTLNWGWQVWMASCKRLSRSFDNFLSLMNAFRTSAFCSRMYVRNCCSHAATSFRGTLSR